MVDLRARAEKVTEWNSWYWPPPVQWPLTTILSVLCTAAFVRYNNDLGLLMQFLLMWFIVNNWQWWEAKDNKFIDSIEIICRTLFTFSLRHMCTFICFEYFDIHCQRVDVISKMEIILLLLSILTLVISKSMIVPLKAISSSFIFIKSFAYRMPNFCW